MSVTSELTARRITLLAPHVANSIAAGEVVERPASVVKELCENAIDSGATSITVTVEGGGLSRICVVDNGGGIEPEDMRLAVARHATSKITTVDDLAAAATLGFRGEALASIAAVSRVTIRSTRLGARAGRELSVDGSDVISEGAAPAVAGTTVDVRDIFYNTPARLRFLKSERSEVSRAVRVVSDLALSQPQIAFECVVDGRRSFQTPGSGLRDAVAAVLGRQEVASLLEVQTEDAIRITGFAAQPHRHRGQRNGMVVMVNGRRVHNRALYVAIENAYRGLIPVGRFPACVLNIEVPFSEVDVNVHPAKTEVRFVAERAVFAALERACWTALSGATVAAPESGSWFAAAVAPVRAAAGDDAQLVLQDAPAPRVASTYLPMPHAAPAGDSTLESLAPLTAVGQVNNQWLVAQSPKGVVIVDPHAAHEKLIYTRLMNEDATALLSQLLLVPVVIDVAPDQMAFVAASTSDFEALGLSIEEFGPASVRCTAVPSAATDSDVERLVRGLIDELAGETDTETRKHRACALVACHSAVRLGDALDLHEQQRLLDELPTVPRATTCPHGRPTVFVLDDRTLRSAFGRP
jgi:DNA mismatch repair protein MutL